jgi:hypothetical protein
MRTAPVLLGAIALAALQAACDDGVGPDTGLTQPMITSGQFVPGDLPGTPPLADDAAAPVMAGGDAGAAHLEVRGLSVGAGEIQAGGGSQSFSGTVTSDAVAVGMRIQSMGTGYWVVPVGSPDPSDPTVVGFGATVGFEPTIPPGVHNLLFVAIDASGRGGVQTAEKYCFANIIPDNNHVCNPTKAPPAAVLTLTWDTNFDLDLHVVTPDGTDINPQAPYGTDVVDAGPSDLANLPHIDRDALRGCVANGQRQEDVIFPQPLPRGTYTINVDPYAACGQAATRFTFTLRETRGTCPDCNLETVGNPVSGELLASQVTGGVLTPLKINTIVVP